MIYDYNLKLPDDFNFGCEGLDEGLNDFRHYQAIQAMKYATKCLNVGCNNDPADIGRLIEDVVNLDARDTDPSIDQSDLTKVKGFVKGDLREMGYEEQFDCIILGELLEHMTWRAIFEHLQATWIALQEKGTLIITTPEEHPCRLTLKYSAEKYMTDQCADGCYPIHVTWITELQLREALEWSGFTITDFRVLRSKYGKNHKTENYAQRFINQSNHFCVTAVKSYPKWRMNDPI